MIDGTGLWESGRDGTSGSVVFHIRVNALSWEGEACQESGSRKVEEGVERKTLKMGRNTGKGFWAPTEPEVERET